jgi:hypothetical protein
VNKNTHNEKNSEHNDEFDTVEIIEMAKNGVPASVRAKRSLVNNKQPAHVKKPIFLMIFIHDDLESHDKNSLYDNYFSWLKTELEDISGRTVSIIFNTKSIVPEMTNFSYQSDSAGDSLFDWAAKVKAFTSIVENTNPYDPNLDKFLLLTRHTINSGVGGIAYNRGQSGIASIFSYLAPAHEVGHMFGATHEDSDIVYDGWWHDTIMKRDVNSPVRGNYYHFSEKNRENIRNYLNQFD